MNAYSRTCLSFLAALLLGFAGLFPATVWSADAVGTAAGKGEEAVALPSTDDLETRIADLEKLEVTDEVHKLELTLLREVRLALRNAHDAETRAAQFQQVMDQAPAELRRIQGELAAPLPGPTVAEDNVDALAQQLAEARQALDTALQERTLVRTEETSRVSRNQQIPGELSEARKRISEILTAQSAAVSPDVPSVISATKRLSLSAELAYQQQRVKALDTELLSYVARQDLLRARSQLAERHVLIAQRDVESLEKHFNALQTRQAEEAQRTAEAGRVATGTAHPALRQIADQNAVMAEELAGISTKSQTLASRKQAVDEQLQTLQQSFMSIKARIEQVGLTNAIGLHLRAQLQQLPDISKLQRRVNNRETEMNAVQMRRTELDDALLRLVDLQGEARARLATDVPEDLPEDELRSIEKGMVEALADQKKNYLDTLINAYDLYFTGSLMPLHDSEQRLLEITTEYDKFIAEKILWIQSDQPLSYVHLFQAVGAIQWLLSPTNWLLAAKQVSEGAAARPAQIVGLLILVGALFLLLPRLRRQLNGYGKAVQSSTQTALMPTLLATAVTLLIAAPLPALLLSISLILPQPGDTGFSGALATGFSRIAILLYAAELWRIGCRRNGLAEAHFKWSRQNLELVRFHLRWFVPVILPLAFVIAVTNAQPVDEYRESLGRLAFILAMIAEAAFIQRLLLPSAGVFSHWLQKHGAGWLARLKYLWFPAAVSAPLGLALAAALGYFYTGLQLEQRLLETIWMLLAVLVLHALLIHWLHLEHRRLAIEQYQKKREAQAKEQAAAAPESEIPAGLLASLDLDEDELQTLSTQALKFVNTLIVFTIALGLILVWQDVFPAFGMLREIELWNVVIPAAGDAAAGAVPQTLPITLADLSTAILILVVTVVVSSNIPGLLEMAVLQHLPLAPSSRYAFTTIVRYLIVILGVVWTFAAIGIGWSKVQFLAAAITVGLGFGLQEIFANFVSGLIMLFERQVRVGDAVTIGNTSGIVSRIRMRATTITDWNLKELIIPNKEFVTGQVINWSLSDPKLRLDIPVGIAYGSDTDLAVKTLLEVAHGHKQVMNDPEAKALFIAFGDSTLNYELRVYIPSYDQIIPVRHDLLTAIDKAFRERGIEIAFPQRDIHIRSADPAINALLGRGDKPAG